MPGDLRFWKALSESLPGIKFYGFRGLAIEWEDSVQESSFPELETWVEWLCPPGAFSLGLSEQCDVPCVQRRKLGNYTTTLETLVWEILEREGYPKPKAIWEASHFEVKGDYDEGDLEDNLSKLIGLGSKSGLFDEATEEVRYLRTGDAWSWTEDHDLVESLTKLGISELVARWKVIPSSRSEFDSLRRSYKMHEISPAREKLRNRKSAPIFDKVDKIILDGASAQAEKFDESSGLGVFRISHSRHAEEILQKEELSSALNLGHSFLDQPIALTCWDERTSHRSRLSRVGFRQFLNGRGPIADCKKLYALRPISKQDFLTYRRAEAVLFGLEEIYNYRPWCLSGGATWLGALRNMLASHAGWQLHEKELRLLFEWELNRSAEFDLILFASDLEFSSVEAKLAAYGLEVYSLGEKVDGGLDALRVQMKSGENEEISWDDLIPDDELDGSMAETSDMSWQMPDRKTPAFGFEKISVFPDQYLLRILKARRKSKLQVGIDWNHRTHDKAREVRLRNEWDTPLQAQKRSAGAGRHFVEAFKSGQGMSGVNPRAASIWAVEYCYRELVARGVNPQVPIHLAFSVNRPHYVQASEKNSKNFAAYTMAIEGVLEALSHTSMRLVSCDLEQVSNPLRDYECEPLIHMRAEMDMQDQAIFPGFRMSGEILYAVGPRPIFMDAGSRVLPFVRVASNHVTKIQWSQQMELYHLLHEAHQQKMITDARPIGHGGVSETLLDMALWSGIGIQLKPGLSTMDLFSGAPGRFLVGILPQEEKNFESLIKGEWLTPVGKSGGEKLFGLMLEDFKEAKSWG